MVSLLKTFGKGILYVIGLPFFLLALALFGVYGLFAFLFQAIKSIIFFFTGQRFFPELEEDKEVKQIKERENPQYQANTIDDIQKEETPSPIQSEEPLKEETPLFTHYEEEIVTKEEIREEPIVNSVEEACFQEEIVQEETPLEENNDSLSNLLNEDNVQEEQIDEIKEEENTTILETSEKIESEEDLVEELETYVPRSSNYVDENDEDDADLGVDIDYDVR